MLLLGVDIETGGAFGTPHEENFITEVGAVIWDTEYNAPMEMMSNLINVDRVIHPDCMEYTGINNDMCHKFGYSEKQVRLDLTHMMLEADFIVAHNGNQFDRPIIEHWMGDLIPFRPWIDTYEDVPYPKNCKHVNLMYLNGFHGFCNPYSHRAVFDVCAMLKVLSHYDINVVTANAMSEKIVIRAEVSFHDKQLAKDKSFGWEQANGKTFHKMWVKKIRVNELEKYRAECPFKINIVEECFNGNREKKQQSPL